MTPPPPPLTPPSLHSLIADLELSTVKKRMDKITSDYKKEEGDKQKRLSSNRKEQEELRKKLSQLECEEERLQEELSLGQSQEQEACDAKKEVMSDVEVWRGKIVELQGRSETSLKVMKVMSGERGMCNVFCDRIGYVYVRVCVIGVY